jgi:hypothetical protein
MSRVRRILVAATFVAALILPSTAALADPSFGPGGSDGNGNNDPQEQGAGCHPPGQTDDLPQCN